MNLRILPLSQMVTITSAWVDEHEKIFLNITEIAGLWPHIKKVHETALQVHAATRKNAILVKIRDKLFVVDLRQDRAIHVIWYGLEAEIAWCYVGPIPDLERADRLMRLRQQILPEGIAWTQRSFLEESGNAARVLAQLDKGARALLAEVPMGRTNLLEVVTRWGALAAELGDLERQRSLIVEANEQVPSDYAARMDWIRVVNGVLSTLELSTASEQAIKTIRQPLIDAVAAEERRAAARARRQEAAGVEGESDTEAEQDEAAEVSDGGLADQAAGQAEDPSADEAVGQAEDAPDHVNAASRETP